MNDYNLNSLIPEDFSPKSKVWIYQSSRPFNEQEALEINEQLLQFYLQWHAHGKPVKGWGKLLFDRFIVLMADETQTAVSGCSLDSSVYVVKSIEKQYQVDLFDRLSLIFLIKDKAEVLPLNQVQYAVDNNYINGDTLLFNNLVFTKQELLEKWLTPVSETWLKDRIELPA